jgi:long-chain acyl-CoA synthetase
MTTYPTIKAMFEAAVQRRPDGVFIRYFDAGLTYSEVDRLSDAFAAGLQAHGFAHGDRLCAQMQSVPQAIIAMVAVWKLGGVFVPMNPMYKARESGLILRDAEPKVFLAEPQLLVEVYSQLDEDVPRPGLVLSALASEYAHVDPRVAPTAALEAPYGDMADFIRTYDGRKPVPVEVLPDDLGSLIYTSGTTGLPKGAMGTQRGLALGGELARVSHDLDEYAAVLTLAPLFHVSGVVMSVALAMHAAATVIITYRFNPDVIVETIRDHTPQVSAGSITAFIAIMNAPDATPETIAKLRTPMSGGAPVPAPVADAYKARYGVALRTGYGLTETTGAAFMEPLSEPRRVDPATGSLSVGKVLPTFEVDIVDDEGRLLPAGQPGEVVFRGPAVSPGYWRKPEETAEAMRSDGFYSGDVGFFDQDGWLYLIDRKKDVIIAGGYKVWPREVEDVIYAHPSVREVAVIGAADAYRGETVKAVLSLKPNCTITIDEILTHCRDRLAAYKVPRVIDVIADLPKNPGGKILRRALRD